MNFGDAADRTTEELIRAVIYTIDYITRVAIYTNRLYA